MHQYIKINSNTNKIEQLTRQTHATTIITTTAYRTILDSLLATKSTSAYAVLLRRNTHFNDKCQLLWVVSRQLLPTFLYNSNTLFTRNVSKTKLYGNLFRLQYIYY